MRWRFKRRLKVGRFEGWKVKGEERVKIEDPPSKTEDVAPASVGMTVGCQAQTKSRFQASLGMTGFFIGGYNAPLG
jgi:hypothetical protein